MRPQACHRAQPEPNEVTLIILRDGLIAAGLRLGDLSDLMAGLAPRAGLRTSDPAVNRSFPGAFMRHQATPHHT